MRHTLLACALAPLYLVTTLTGRAADKAFAMESNTVALWNFSEGQGFLVRDEGPQKLNLMLPETPLFAWTTGKFGSALHFPDKYMLTTTKKNRIEFDKEITVEAWIKIDKEAENKGLGIIQNIVWANSGFRMGTDELGHVTWAIQHPDSKSEAYLRSTSQIYPDTWTHVAGTYDGQKMKIFINGTLDAEKKQQGGVITPTEQRLYIGYLDSKNPSYFLGEMNGIRISDVAKQEFPMP